MKETLEVIEAWKASEARGEPAVLATGVSRSETEVAKIDGVVEVKEATHPPPCEPYPGRRTTVHASAGV